MKRPRDDAPAECGPTSRHGRRPRRGVPRWALAVLGPVLILLALCTRDAIAWVGQPFAGLLFGDNAIVYSIGRAQWRLPSLRRAEWARIVAVEGAPIATGTDVHAAVRTARSRDTLTYTFRRGSETFRLAIPRRVFTWADFAEVFAPMLGVGAWLIVVAALLLAARPELPEVRTHFAVCLLLGLLLITGPDEYGPYRWTWIFFIALALLPPAVLHLAASFLWEPGRPSERVVASTYVLFGALGVGLTLYRSVPTLFLPLLYLVYFALANAILLYAGALVSALVTGRRFRPQVVAALAAILASGSTVIAVLVTYPLRTEPVSAPWFIVPIAFWPVLHGLAFVRLAPDAEAA